MTRREMEKLRHALRALKASVTSLGEFLRARPKYPDPLHLLWHRLKGDLQEMERRERAEHAALLEPHAFIRPAMPPPLDRRCVRCGFGRADAELHPPEMQVQRLASDAARYEALGNSMAVCVVRWVFRRLEAVEMVLRRQAA